MGKEELYKRAKIAGMISFIPIILVTGPLGGYFLGDFLVSRFKSAPYLLYISIGIGLLGSVREVIRIIRIVSKIEKKP